MAARKQFLAVQPVSEEFKKRWDTSRQTRTTESDLQEQRISFAFGNALGLEEITKESTRETSKHIRIR